MSKLTKKQISKLCNKIIQRSSWDCLKNGDFEMEVARLSGRQERVYARVATPANTVINLFVQDDDMLHTRLLLEAALEGVPTFNVPKQKLLIHKYDPLDTALIQAVIADFVPVWH